MKKVTLSKRAKQNLLKIVAHVQHNFSDTVAWEVYFTLLKKINSLGEIHAGKLKDPNRELYARVFDGNTILFRIKKDEILITDVKPRKTF